MRSYQGRITIKWDTTERRWVAERTAKTGQFLGDSNHYWFGTNLDAYSRREKIALKRALQEQNPDYEVIEAKS